jgi:hypothetical protein
MGFKPPQGDIARILLFNIETIRYLHQAAETCQALFLKFMRLAKQKRSRRNLHQRVFLPLKILISGLDEDSNYQGYLPENSDNEEPDNEVGKQADQMGRTRPGKQSRESYLDSNQGAIK